MSDWDFGGAYANTQKAFTDIAGEQQAQEQAQQMFPTELAHRQALTRLQTAQAALEENTLTTRQTLARVSQGLSFDDPTASQSANVMKMAGAAMQSGDPTLAQTLTLRASQLHTQEARELYYKSRQQKEQTTMQLKMTDRFGQLMGGVRNEQDFNAAKMMFESEFGEPAPQVPYSPENVAMLRESTLTMSQRLRAQHEAVMENLRRTAIGNVAGYRGELLKLRKQDFDRKVERDNLAKANAGKDIGSPTRLEAGAATSFLSNEGKLTGLDPDAANTAAFDLASRAKQKRKLNPGLSASEAMGQAYQDQVGEGYFGTKQSTSLLGLYNTEKPSFGKPGGSPERAAPVPANRANLKANIYYNTPKGPLLYLGGGKWKAPLASSSRASSGYTAPEDDEEE